VVLENPLRVEVMRDGLLAHGSLQYPLAGKVVEQGRIDGRLLRGRNQTREYCCQEYELLSNCVVHFGLHLIQLSPGARRG
jgi:hypothetical protein